MPISFPLRIFLALCLVVTCIGCSFPLVKDPGKALMGLVKPQGALELENGIKNYEEGDYKTAAKQLQSSLDLGLDSQSDQGSAHKYLAFIHCTSGRERACREEFRKAFDSDPKFELQPAESGHPIWGPVFRSVKTEVTGKAKTR